MSQRANTIKNAFFSSGIEDFTQQFIQMRYNDPMSRLNLKSHQFQLLMKLTRMIDLIQRHMEIKELHYNRQAFQEINSFKQTKQSKKSKSFIVRDYSLFDTVSQLFNKRISRAFFLISVFQQNTQETPQPITKTSVAIDSIDVVLLSKRINHILFGRYSNAFRKIKAIAQDVKHNYLNKKNIPSTKSQCSQESLQFISEINSMEKVAIKFAASQSLVYCLEKQSWRWYSYFMILQQLIRLQVTLYNREQEDQEEEVLQQKITQKLDAIQWIASILQAKFDAYFYSLASQDNDSEYEKKLQVKLIAASNIFQGINTVVFRHFQDIKFKKNTISDCSDAESLQQRTLKHSFSLSDNTCTPPKSEYNKGSQQKYNSILNSVRTQIVKINKFETQRSLDDDKEEVKSVKSVKILEKKNQIFKAQQQSSSRSHDFICVFAVLAIIIAMMIHFDNYRFLFDFKNK